MWILEVVSDTGDSPIRFRILPGGAKTIGRAGGADFVVDAPLVSRVHCRVTATEAGQLDVQDLDSTNGTFVNDRRVVRSPLVPGDTLRIGRLELRVRAET